MKILIYGLQSSGASLFTYFMAQNLNSFAMIDLYCNAVAPPVDFKDGDTIIKCTINPSIPFSQHVKSYNPDKTILVLRDPFDNYVSLKSKPWGNDIESKFELLEKTFSKGEDFDAVIDYSTFVLFPSSIVHILKQKGIPADNDYINFDRTFEDIGRFNYKNIPEHSGGKNQYSRRRLFGTGGIKVDGKVVLNKNYISKDISYSDREKVLKLCPTVCERFGRGLIPLLKMREKGIDKDLDKQNDKKIDKKIEKEFKRITRGAEKRK